jgi:hypothetical protein
MPDILILTLVAAFGWGAAILAYALKEIEAADKQQLIRFYDRQQQVDERLSTLEKSIEHLSIDLYESEDEDELTEIPTNQYFKNLFAKIIERGMMIPDRIAIDRPYVLDHVSRCDNPDCLRNMLTAAERIEDFEMCTAIKSRLETIKAS